MKRELERHCKRLIKKFSRQYDEALECGNYEKAAFNKGLLVAHLGIMQELGHQTRATWGCFYFSETLSRLESIQIDGKEI